MKLSVKGKKILEWVGNIIAIICVLCLFWAVVFFVDVNMHNGLGGTGPSDWNMFKILVECSSG